MRKSFPKERQVAFLTESCMSMEVWGKAWRMEWVVDSVSMRGTVQLCERMLKTEAHCWWSWSEQAEGLGLDPSLRGRPDLFPPRDCISQLEKFLKI